MPDNYNNIASTAALAAGCGTADPTWTVSGVTNWPATPFWAQVARETPTMEIVKVTNVTGATWTVTRAQGGTTASAHGAGDEIKHIIPADAINALEAHLAALTNVHGLAVGSSVVGTNDAQTVINKKMTGALRAVFSDATTPAWTTAFEVAADSAAAKDGFVYRNTAADPARAAFLVEQSGTDRFRVSPTGKVTVNPASGVGIENDGTLQQDGNATFNGTLTATAATTLAATSATTLSTSGAATLASASVTGNATVGGTLGVTGTTTLAAVNATNGTLSGTLGVTGATTVTSLAATGTVTATNGVRSLGSTLPDIAVVTALPASGTTDQVVWLTTNRKLHRWNGTAWTLAQAYTQLRQSVVQSIPTATGPVPYTPLTFTTEDSDPLDAHSVSTNTSRWTAPYSGPFEFTGAYVTAQTAAGPYGAAWAKNQTGPLYTPLPGSLIAVPSAGAGLHTCVQARTIVLDLVAGDWVELLAWNNAGSTRDTVVTSEHQSMMTVRAVA